MSTAIVLSPHLGRITALLVRDHGFVGVRGLRLVQIGDDPFNFGTVLEATRDDGSILLLSVAAIGGVSMRNRIYSTEEVQEKRAATQQYEAKRFEFLSYATRAEYEAIAARQEICAAGPQGRCGGQLIATIAIGHVREGKIYCGADSGYAIRYGREFDATWHD